MATNDTASEKLCNGDDTVMQQNGIPDSHIKETKKDTSGEAGDDPDEQDDKESCGPFVLFKPIGADSDSDEEAVDNFRVQPHSNVKNKTNRKGSDSESPSLEKVPLDRGDNCNSQLGSENSSSDIKEPANDLVQKKNDSDCPDINDSQKIVEDEIKAVNGSLDDNDDVPVSNKSEEVSENEMLDAESLNKDEQYVYEKQENSAAESEQESKDKEDITEDSETQDSVSSDKPKPLIDEEKVEKSSTAGSDIDSDNDNKKNSHSSCSVEKVMDVDGSEVIITLNDDESDQEKDEKKKDFKADSSVEETKDNVKGVKGEIEAKSQPVKVIKGVDSSTPVGTDSASKTDVKDKVALLNTSDALNAGSSKGKESVVVVSISPTGSSSTVLGNTMKSSSLLASAVSTVNMNSGIRLAPPNIVTVPSQNPTFLPYYFQQPSLGIPVHQQNRLSQPMTMSPQTQQTGYITKVGNQTIFVPMATSAGKPIAPFNTVSNVKTSFVTQNAAAGISGQPSATMSKPESKPKPEFVTPKSSMDMMEQCKWEVANRIPDNYNWSVVFHHKKDQEVSTITAFLQELGSDIVKEAVYKDIIQIQTTKLEMGKLTVSEKGSLEKMKTVYKETKDRVGELKLDTKKCRGCNFKTESRNVMTHHKELAHETPKEGEFLCVHCNFLTRNSSAFLYHFDAMHKGHGRIMDKPAFFECELCPFETNNKNKLGRHKFRCLKQFKLQQNLQPYYHDVNFCMKTMYFKMKKPAQKTPVPDVRLKNQDPSKKTMNTNYQPQKMIPRPAARNNLNMIRAPSQQTTIRTPGIIVPTTRTNLVSSRPHLASALQRPALGNHMSAKPSPTVHIRHSKPMLPTAANSPATAAGKMDMSKFEVCELCGGYVKDRQALRIHFYYAHKVEMPLSIFDRPSPPLICEVCQARFWTTQGLSKHKTNTKHFSAPSPASSKDQRCFMCSRTVPNLFAHIEQVHGMTMKDLVAMKKCIMCGATSTNRRELEIHMAALHGVLIKASEFDNKPTPVVTSVKATPSPITSPQQGTSANSGVKKQSLVRNNLCVFCQVQFSDNIQLTVHCIKNHATCSACGMVVARKTDLDNHHCKKLASKNCSLCNLRKLTPEAYLKHVKTHLKKCSVHVTQLSKKVLDKYPKPAKRSVEVIDLLDSDDDSDDQTSTLPEKKASEGENSDLKPRPRRGKLQGPKCAIERARKRRLEAAAAAQASSTEMPSKKDGSPAAKRQKLDTEDEKTESVEEETESMEEKSESYEEKTESMEERSESMKESAESMEERAESMEERAESMEERAESKEESMEEEMEVTDEKTESVGEKKESENVN